MRSANRSKRQPLILAGIVCLVVLATTLNAVLFTRVVYPLLPPGRASSPASSADGGPSSGTASPTSAVTPSPGQTLLPGAGSDIIYAQSAAAIYRIDLATGAMSRTLTPELTQFSSFVATPGGVVSKTVDNDSGVVVRGSELAQPLPTPLRVSGRLYPAADGKLWLVPETSTDGYRIAAKVDLDGDRVATPPIRLPDEFGIPNSDQRGQLLITNAGGVYEATQVGLSRLGTGQLLAIGLNHVLTWDCDARARCDVYRLDRSSGRRTVLRADRQAMLDTYQSEQSSASSYQGALSANGEYAAIAGPPSGANDRPISVVNLRTGTTDVLPGSGADLNPNAQATWTSNSRWLLALTDGRLRTYDTTTRVVRTINVGNEALQHLTNVSGTGF